MQFITLPLLALLSAAACNATPGAKPAAPAPPGAPGARPAAAAIALPPVPDADPRERVIAQAVRELLQREHLAASPIDDPVSRRAMQQFIKHLDGGKLFLLEPQVRVLQGHATELDDQLEAGDLKLARLASALLAQQRALVAAMVADLLSRPFDLDRDEFLETDDDKRDFAASDAELKDRWRRLLQLQVLERVARMERTLQDRQDVARAAAGKADGAAEPRARGKDAGKDAGQAEAAAPAAEPIPETDQGRRDKARQDLANVYAGRFTRLAAQTPLDAVEVFVNAVTAVFDPHTLYLAPDDKANFDIQMTGSLEGIGAVLTEDDHYIQVREVVAGGAAWRQGDLDAGDLILAVEQAGAPPVDIADMRLNDVVKIIRGPKGTRVTLTVRKADDEVRVIPITRDVVVVEATYARGALLNQGQGQKPVGYIFLPGFYGGAPGGRPDSSERDATNDVRALLERFRQKGVDAVILDLRSNGGGLLSAANDITGLFIERGPVVQVRGSNERISVLADEDPRIFFEGELLVMVDRFSASASEILAGALQDYGRALLVGTGQTHGKGTVQALADLNRVIGHQGPPLGVLKLTIQQYFLADGRSTQLRGVQPDIVLPDPASFVESGERYLDNAMASSTVAPLPHEHWDRSHWKVDELRALSAARQQKQPLFDRVQARGAYLKARQDDTRIPLSQRAWTERRKKDEDALEALDPKLDEQPAQLHVQGVEYRPRPASESDSARAATHERMQKWQDGLARDPWLAESVQILRDMSAPPTTPTGVSAP